MSTAQVSALLRRWFPALVLGPLLGGLTCYLIVRNAPLVYEAQTTLMIGRASVDGETRAEDLAGAGQLAHTYAEVVRTRPVIQEAAGRLGLTEPVGAIQQRVAARPVPQTQLIRITAEDTDPVAAAQLANTVAEVFVARTLQAQSSRFASSRENLAALVSSLRSDIDTRTRRIDQLRTQPSSAAGDSELARLQSEVAQLQAAFGETVRSYEALRIAEARSTNALTILEPATPTQTAVRPQILRMTLLAALAALAVSVALAALAEYFDDRLRGRRYLQAATGLVPMAEIPDARGRWDPSSVLDRSAAGPFRLLATNLAALTQDRPPRLLVVSSARPGEGKSTVAANLALALAESGQRVLLVDADLREPRQAELFGLRSTPGLSSIGRLPETKLASVIQSTTAPNLQVIPAGPESSDPSAQLLSQPLRDKLLHFTKLFDLVVLDTPAVLSQPDAPILASLADGVLFVVDASSTRRADVVEALDTLHTAGARVIGAVLNRVTEHIPPAFEPRTGATDGLGRQERDAKSDLSPVLPGGRTR